MRHKTNKRLREILLIEFEQIICEYQKYVLLKKQQTLIYYQIFVTVINSLNYCSSFSLCRHSAGQDHYY